MHSTPALRRGAEAAQPNCRRMAPWIRCAMLLVLPLAALTPCWATSPKAPAPDPADPHAPVPAVVYRSVLQPLKPANSGEPAPDARTWQKANELVWRIGGWRTYAREPLEPAAATTVVPQAAPRAASAADATSNEPAAVKPAQPDPHRHPVPGGVQR